MTKRIEIQESLTYYEDVLERGRGIYKQATIYGIVQYPRTGKETQIPHKFLIDTGAAISILNKEFTSFVDETFKEVDYTRIQYGGNKVKLPVYEMMVTIRGINFPCRMAFDRNLELPSLLGQFDFLNEFNFLVLDYKKGVLSKLIKQPWNS